MFRLLERHGENICFKCGGIISAVSELSLEHKKAWQEGGASLFWDLDNVTFSHRRCNLRTGWVRREIIDGMLWCSSCKQLLHITLFHKDRHQRTGFALLCKACFNAKRKQVKAQGNCTQCGAMRGDCPFRIGHNICMKCHHLRTRSNRDRQRRTQTSDG